jgi:hypothetical protein
MPESTYHLVALFVQIVGLGLIIFKGGNYIGQSNEMFKGLTEKITRQEEDLDAHKREDVSQFTKINDKLTDIQVSVAASNHQHKGK